MRGVRVVPHGLAVVIILGAPPNATSQVVTPRTVPVLIGQQFDILPSHRGGMAGVTIALDDTLIDPFVNPVKAVRVREGLFSVAPFFYRASNTDGGASTFPVSGVAPLGSSAWSAGVSSRCSRWTGCA